MIDAASWAALLGEEKFLAQQLFRSHHIVRGPRDDAARLLSWDGLNTLIASHRMEPPRFRLSKGGEALSVHRYAIPFTNRRSSTWQRTQPAELHARLAEGASLVLDSIDEMYGPIRQSAEGLERFLRTPVQVNAYASWSAKEGFGTHWDDHDVVVVQVAGAKRWRIYGPTRQVPTWQDTEAPQPPEGDPVADEVLTAGDVLYLPRGWWHAVTADQGTPSLHLTFGLTTQSGADFLHWVVDQLRIHRIVRMDMPRFAAPGQQDVHAEQLGREIAGALAQPGRMQRWAEALDTTHPGRLRPSLPYVNEVPAVPLIAVRLTCPRARLRESDGLVTLSAAGTSWDFAAPARPMLDTLLAGEPVTLGALAEACGQPLEDVAAVVSALVQGQAASVVGAVA